MILYNFVVDMEYRAITNRKNLDREISRLALPNMLSNVAVPLLGMADIAIAGYVGGDRTIGAIGIGSTIFNMIYWNCCFLRMGSSGLTAQSYGAGAMDQCKLLLLRGVFIGLIISLLLLVFKDAVCTASLWLIGGEALSNADADIYLHTRYWAIPASISLFAISGWFIGMQDSVSPMLIAIGGNIANVALSALFAISFGMGISGVALGTVVAQYASLAAAVAIYMIGYRKMLPHVRIAKVFAVADMGRFLSVNSNIFLRTLCVVTAFTSFTSLSSRYGATVLAANTLLIQLQTLFGYLIDGMGFAAESLVGRFVGARDSVMLRMGILKLTRCGLYIALGSSIVCVSAWHPILSLFSPSAETMEYASSHIAWVSVMPLACFFAFIADGIMIGATQTRIMRDTLAIALAIAAVCVGVGMQLIGADAIWLGMLVFMSARSLQMIGKVKKLARGTEVR